MRSPMQVMVFPYRPRPDGSMEYAVFRRSDAPNIWQAIAGGGEDDETPMETAIRESAEEAAIPPEAKFVELDSIFTVPAEFVSGFLWGPDVLVITQHCFGVEIGDRHIALSAEHTEFEWCTYQRALSRLTFESNRLALWELNHRLTR